jgi:alpha-glucosidase
MPPIYKETAYMPTPLSTAVDVTSDPDWWRQAVVYQIYPRSFADANGDGIGDLKGITSRIPYLASLGIDAVWLSPFYPSALADGGYDVDDYRNVDPRLGTLDDFDEMIGAMHTAGLKLIVDIVPNHTSNRHQWFIQALAAAPGSAERAKYVFRDGKGTDGTEPPSDWPSFFGGSAWERVPDGQWYLHLFAKEQPDLNWDNREVRDDFLTTLRFWADRGVDGFRVDVAHQLVKDFREPFPDRASLDLENLPHGSHPFEDRDEVHEIYAEWRQVFNEYDPPRTAVAEAWVHATRRARYASPQGLGQAFNFDLLQSDFDATSFRRIITHNLTEAHESGASSTWVLSNHDVTRHPTRYGLPRDPELKFQDGKSWLLSNGTTPSLSIDLGIRRALAATLLILALPGSAYLYQGEELGLHEVGDLPAEALQDPTFTRSDGSDKGRDGCRVPLPWTPGGPSFGFGDGPAHLPQPKWFGSHSVQTEENDPTSPLRLYRQALSLRRKLQTTEELDWVVSGESVLHFRRPGGWQSITNFGDEPVDIPPGTVLSSAPLNGDQLPPNATAWII